MAAFSCSSAAAAAGVVVVLSSLLLQQLSVVLAEGSFQSGPNSGAIYAGGLDYIENSIYITGITYDFSSAVAKESSCFVSKMDSKQLQNHELAITSRIGSGSIMEACHGISLLHDPLIPISGGYKPFVVSGTSDPGGVYGSIEEVPSGFLMALNPSSDTEDFAIEAGLSVDDAGGTNTVSYPVSILYEYNTRVGSQEDMMDVERRDGQIFIASLSSVDFNLSSDHEQVLKMAKEKGQPDQPNWMKYRKYGKSFEMTINRLTTRPDDNGMGVRIEEDWTETYPIDIDPETGEKPDVYLGGMIYKKIIDHPGTSDGTWLADLGLGGGGSIDEILIVAGSTRGIGIGYGDAEGDDEDGFISVVSTLNGKLINEDGNNSNVRIGTDKTDLILGICDDPTNPNAFYIVGTTAAKPFEGEMGDRVERTVVMTNDGSLHGYIQKIQLDTLEKIWGAQWGANHMGERMENDSGDDNFGDGDFGEGGKPTLTAGIGCHVLKDGSVYVAGIVEDGAHIKMDERNRSTHKGDSIVAGKFDGQSGQVQWITQFGSDDGHEQLAQYSSGIAVDENENLILYGDTTGSMFRSRSDSSDGSSDIFLTTLSKEDGSHNTIGMPVQVGGDGTIALEDENFGNGGGGLGFGGLGFGGLGLGSDYSGLSDEEKWELYKDGDWEGGFNEGSFGESNRDDDHFFMGGQLGDGDGEGGDHDYGGYGPNGNGYGRAFNNGRFGIQSGPKSGSTFAGGMAYNADEDSVYLTGISYDDSNSQSNCILTKLFLAGGTTDKWSEATDKTFGSSDVIESCSSIALHRYGEVVTVGNGNSGSSLPKDSSLNLGGGFAMAIDRNNLGQIDATPLVTRTPDDKIQYPISVVSDGDDLYVVSLTSTDSEYSREFMQLMSNGGDYGGFSPNFINMQVYGSSLDMTVTKITLKEQLIDGVTDGDITFTTAWSKEFPVSPDGDGSGIIPRVFLGGAIVKKNLGYLAIAGSTRGLGEGYGAAVGMDEDGFITLLDLQTGELSTDVDRNNIREGSAEDDIVLGICHDPADHGSFYVVGGTKGVVGTPGTTKDVPDGSLQAFIRKVDAYTLAEMWTIQWGAIHKNGALQSSPTVAKAFDCAVSDDVVYVAGVVDDNAEIVKGDSPRMAQGGDDIWVGAVNVQGGDVKWLRQAGSPGNDHIAPHGGLAINKNGNVIVFGDTNGAFYRERSESTTSDMFVMEFGKNGLHKRHVRAPIRDNTPATAPEPAAAPEPTAGPPTVRAEPVQLVPDSTSSNSAKEPAASGSGNNKISTGALAGLLIVVILLLVAPLSYFVYRRLGCRRSKKTVDEVHGPEIQVKDGLIANKSSSYRDQPPQSAFSDGGFGDDPLGGYSSNLKDIGKRII